MFLKGCYYVCFGSDTIKIHLIEKSKFIRNKNNIFCIKNHEILKILNMNIGIKVFNKNEKYLKMFKAYIFLLLKNSFFEKMNYFLRSIWRYKLMFNSQTHSLNIILPPFLLISHTLETPPALIIPKIMTSSKLKAITIICMKSFQTVAFIPP